MLKINNSYKLTPGRYSTSDSGSIQIFTCFPDKKKINLVLNFDGNFEIINHNEEYLITGPDYYSKVILESERTIVEVEEKNLFCRFFLNSNSQLEGLYSLYRDKELIETIEYLNDVRCGKYYSRLEPNKHLTTNYLNGLYNGEYCIYDSLNNFELIREIYSLGLKMGPYLYRHPNGVISEKGEYIDNLRHGQIMKISEKGEILSLENYIMGNYHGKQEYFEFGKIIIKKYSMGLLLSIKEPRLVKKEEMNLNSLSDFLKENGFTMFN